MDLKILETFDAGGDIKNFMQLEEKIDILFTSPAKTSDDTLQIMTIHKAKGLEFDTIILPGLHHIIFKNLFNTWSALSECQCKNQRNRKSGEWAPH